MERIKHLHKRADLRSLDYEGLQSALIKVGEPKYRAKQIWEWLWNKQVHDFGAMTNLPKALREKLDSEYEMRSFASKEEQRSADGTVKMALRTYDQKVIESVLIPTEKRKTACISSQVGCSLSCAFCATGRLKRLRNLEAFEIFDQVVEVDRVSKELFGVGLTNIVYMGMGEPLLNLKQVLHSIDRITAEDGLGMSPKRITVSTAGIAKMIRKLGEEKVRFNLALSLHAANDEKRSKIMPINDSNRLDVLAAAMNDYYSKTKNKLTFEYIIFKNFNDEIQDAKELLDFCHKVPSKVNIIEYNSIDGGEFEQALPEKVDAFADYLHRNGVVAKVRRSRGKDIDAACGQLANKNELSS
jgi:23S rRNA (adenine2503-C2)-methyltransferase